MKWFIGRPINLHNNPEQIFPKFPLGTEKTFFLFVNPLLKISL